MNILPLLLLLALSACAPATASIDGNTLAFSGEPNVTIRVSDRFEYFGDHKETSVVSKTEGYPNKEESHFYAFVEKGKTSKPDLVLVGVFKAQGKTHYLPDIFSAKNKLLEKGTERIDGIYYQSAISICKDFPDIRDENAPSETYILRAIGRIVSDQRNILFVAAYLEHYDQETCNLATKDQQPELYAAILEGLKRRADSSFSISN